MSRKKNLRRLSVLVTAQTLYNLERLSKMEGDRNVGRVIDKLTRDKMVQFNPHRCAKCGGLKPVDGAPWCETCFDRALGCLPKGEETHGEHSTGI